MKREYPTVRAFSFVVLLLFGLITSCTETSVSEPEPWTYTKSYWNIHIMNADGSNIKDLTHNAFHTWLIDVSPLGSKIIYNSQGVYTMNLMEVISNHFRIAIYNTHQMKIKLYIKRLLKMDIRYS